MALGQRRMLYTNVWQNSDFKKLSDKAKLLYIGLITVADDDGRLRANSLLLRSQIFPYDDQIKQEEIRKWLGEIQRGKLIDFYRVKTEYFIQHPHWHKYQSIRKDLYKPSDIPTNPLRKSNDAVTKSHHKLSKDKLSKDKEEELATLYLGNIPEKDLDEFYQRFDCSKKAIISKGEVLLNYCKMHEKWYRNYKSFLLNALKGDFPERKEPIKTYKPVTPEVETPREEKRSIPEDIKNSIQNIIGAKRITT